MFEKLKGSSSWHSSFFSPIETYCQIYVRKGKAVHKENDDIHAIRQTLLVSEINCHYIHDVQDLDTLDNLLSNVLFLFEFDRGYIAMRTINRAQVYSDIM